MKLPQHLPLAATALAALAFPAALSAATLTFVGVDSDTQGAWRSTDVSKALDGDGDNVYGSDGYVAYAFSKGFPATGDDYQNVSPLTYNGVNFQTYSSIPSYVGLSDNGQTHIAAGFGYVGVDNPTALPGVAVADLMAGLAIREGSRSGSVLDLTFSAAGDFRVGVMFFNDSSFDALSSIAFTQTVGGVSSVSQSFAGAGGAFDIAFFDFTGVASGDTFRLDIAKPDGPRGGGDNNNAVYYGLTFDAAPVPEPSAFAAFAGLATLGFAATRRRRAAR